ncbi:hypothetical protein ACPOL_3106 [Acidisarcina polymorpha]|uniref:Uncharacterized protein n=1 Tax=Acidisarcina polymorpha TaxID=2211140 RepID=A0A2Z5FZT4_9BACT|nr:hypothetical protein ACPOL_3106 [Acidisarcina polymorpha]
MAVAIRYPVAPPKRPLTTPARADKLFSSTTFVEAEAGILRLS